MFPHSWIGTAHLRPGSPSPTPLDTAARTHGFFYAVNYGVHTALIDRLVSHARVFFAQSEAAKMRIPMSAGGRAWRGYFALGGELTSNRPDWKEGLYLGSELGPEHPRVRAGTKMGKVFPDLKQRVASGRA